eukprot:360124-Chlamydomonas_euryale.AAC.6
MVPSDRPSQTDFLTAEYAREHDDGVAKCVSKSAWYAQDCIRSGCCAAVSFHLLVVCTSQTGCVGARPGPGPHLQRRFVLHAMKLIPHVCKFLLRQGCPTCPCRKDTACWLYAQQQQTVGDRLQN